jgi:multidrug efflux system outer membrane protein
MAHTPSFRFDFPRRRLTLCRVTAAASMLALSACNLGPDYQRPDLPTPPQWTAAGDSPANWPSAEWWRGFNSPALDALIAQSQQHNDDIAGAIARVREADAQARIAGAPLLPSLDASFDAAREKVSTQGGHSTASSFGPSLNASYELDFWGKNRAARDAAVATANASRFDRTTVELTVMTSVANTYFEVLALRDRLDIANQNLSAAQSLLDGLNKQLRAGIVNGLDVAQQATTVANLSAAIPPIRQQLRQTQNALAILAGNAPEALNISDGKLADLSQPPVSPGLPSDLLARRPDVAEAEAQLISANADVAAARAAFFPSIDLTASGGYASSALHGLIDPSNTVFSLAAGITQPIFEGGALRGQSDYAKARYDELLSTYHKTVITAFGNVEDALVALEQTADQQQRQQQAVDAAQHAFDFAQKQMHVGTIDVLTLLNTETALFTAQDALVQVRIAHFEALVNLYSALGGGWQQQS